MLSFPAGKMKGPWTPDRIVRLVENAEEVSKATNLNTFSDDRKSEYILSRMVSKFPLDSVLSAKKIKGKICGQKSSEFMPADEYIDNVDDFEQFRPYKKPRVQEEIIGMDTESMNHPGMNSSETAVTMDSVHGMSFPLQVPIIRKRVDWSDPERIKRFEEALDQAMEENSDLHGLKLAIEVCRLMRSMSDDDIHLRPLQIYPKIPHKSRGNAETSNTETHAEDQEGINEKDQSRYSIDVAKQNWAKIVEDAPVYLCDCCEQLNFKRNLRRTTQECMESWPQCIKSFYELPPEICEVCRRELSSGEIPMLCRFTFRFPELPACLKELNEFEPILIAPRMLFYKLVQLGRPVLGQYGIKGTIVNVPADLTRIQTALPRAAKASWLEVCLKRKMSFKITKTKLIRPQKIVEALKYLVEQPVYKERNITISEDWGAPDDFEADVVQEPEDGDTHMDSSDEEDCLQNGPETDNANVSSPMDNENLGFSYDVRDPRPALDTVIDNINIPEDIHPSILSIAPGEGNELNSLLFDKDLEPLAFPCIWGGQRPSAALLDTACQTKAARYLLHHGDGRVRRNKDAVFLLARKTQHWAVSDNNSDCRYTHRF